jgi:hypothetical protein
MEPVFGPVDKVSTEKSLVRKAFRTRVWTKMTPYGPPIPAYSRLDAAYRGSPSEESNSSEKPASNLFLELKVGVPNIPGWDHRRSAHRIPGA